MSLYNAYSIGYCAMMVALIAIGEVKFSVFWVIIISIICYGTMNNMMKNTDTLKELAK